MTKRELAIEHAKIAGYHDDSRTLLRLRIESRVRYQFLAIAWSTGAALRKGGAKCSCHECRARARIAA